MKNGIVCSQCYKVSILQNEVTCLFISYVFTIVIRILLSDITTIGWQHLVCGIALVGPVNHCIHDTVPL